MEQKLTLRQKLSYAHWSAKLTFTFPYLGRFMVLMAALVWLGFALNIFGLEIKSVLQYSGSYATAKICLLVLLAWCLLIMIGYASIYGIFFIHALIGRDKKELEHFFRYHYRKK